jgi:dTMP kinase
MFITGEGKDGAGKSTGMEYLAEKFQGEGRTVHLLHFPNYDTPIGGLIGDIINGRKPMPSFDSLQMLYVADQLAWQNQIEEWIYDGDVVICDRYDLSTLAYYASKTGTGVQKVIDMIYDHWQRNLKKPDHTLIFECEGHVGERRPNTEMDSMETDDNIREFIDDVYFELGEKMSANRHITFVDTNGTIEQTRKQLDEFYSEIFNATDHYSIRNLFGKKNNPEPF